MKIILATAFIFSANAFAEDQHNASLSYEHNVDTDANRLDVTSVRAATDRSDLFWLYPDEQEELHYWQVEFNSLTGESGGS